jgi:hypothetical protein
MHALHALRMVLEFNLPPLRAHEEETMSLIPHLVEIEQHPVLSEPHQQRWDGWSFPVLANKRVDKSKGIGKGIGRGITTVCQGAGGREE